jgi:SAM-dependent methyltransferase
MGDQNTERFLWAKEVMNIKPDHKILEIGCGAGFAVALIAPTLTKGFMMAIDQSKPMIDKAMKRNEELVGSKKILLQKKSLKDFSSGESFHRIFSFNVNVFWTKKSAAQELSVIREHLAPNGLFYTFFGPLFGDGLKKITGPARQNLEKEGFEIKEVIHDKKTNCLGFVAYPGKKNKG